MKQIEEHVLAFYTDLYSENNHRSGFLSEMINFVSTHLPSLVTANENDIWMETLDNVEIKNIRLI